MKLFDIYSAIGVFPYSDTNSVKEKNNFLSKLWSCRLSTVENTIAEQMLSFTKDITTLISTPAGKQEYDFRLRFYLEQNLQSELKAKSIKKGSVCQLLKKAHEYFDSDQTTEALKYLGRLYFEEPTQKVLLMIAECFKELGNPILAIKAYEEAEQLWGNSHAISFRKGSIWEYYGCYSKAFREYSKCPGAEIERDTLRMRRYLGLYDGNLIYQATLEPYEKAELDIGHVILECDLKNTLPEWAARKISTWENENIYKCMIKSFGIGGKCSGCEE